MRKTVIFMPKDSYRPAPNEWATLSEYIKTTSQYNYPIILPFGWTFKEVELSDIPAIITKD